MVGTGIVILLVAIYIVDQRWPASDTSCGSGATTSTSLLHLIVPILGILAFIPAWLTAAGLPVFTFISTLAPPISYAGPAVGSGWCSVVIYLICAASALAATGRRRGRVHLDEEPTAEEPELEAGGPTDGVEPA